MVNIYRVECLLPTCAHANPSKDGCFAYRSHYTSFVAKPSVTCMPHASATCRKSAPRTCAFFGAARLMKAHSLLHGTGLDFRSSHVAHTADADPSMVPLSPIGLVGLPLCHRLLQAESALRQRSHISLLCDNCQRLVKPCPASVSKHHCPHDHHNQ